MTASSGSALFRLDVLDLPLVHYLDTSCVQQGPPQKVHQQGQERACRSGGVVPASLFVRNGQRYPMLRYPWSQLHQSLLGLAQSQPGGEAVQLAFFFIADESPLHRKLGPYEVRNED